MMDVLVMELSWSLSDVDCGIVVMRPHSYLLSASSYSSISDLMESCLGNPEGDFDRTVAGIFLRSFLSQ